MDKEVAINTLAQGNQRRFTGVTLEIIEACGYKGVTRI